MNTFQSEILKDISHAQKKLVIAADPDGLLLDEKIQQEVRRLGFEFMTYSDPIVFRYEYESKYRTKWDVGQNGGERVLLKIASPDLGSLPYDISLAGDKVILGLGRIFPELSYPILEELSPEHLDKLFQTCHEAKPDRMGDNETCDFILRHVFQISPELINAPEDLLKTLLAIHFDKQELPPAINNRLISLVEDKPAFKTWPLKTLFENHDAFFQFLQERWPIFLNRIESSNDLTREPKLNYELNIPGPLNLPFEHRDVRIYFSELFLEGLMRPVRHIATGKLIKKHKWVGVGLITGAHDQDMDNLEVYLEKLQDAIPSSEARYPDWLNFAGRWAHLNEMRYGIPGLVGSEIDNQIKEYQEKVDVAFKKWLSQRYAGLYNMPSNPPLMQHHVPRAMSEICVNQGRRVALLVLDGMSFDQWLIIKHELLKKNLRFKFDESAIFAWVPTITSVARQALFSGNIPANFASSIATTEKEPTLWTQFWVQQGLNREASGYIKGLGDADSLDEVEEMASSPRIKALGLVVDKIDKIMHGSELGEAGMHNQVKHWASQGFMDKLLEILKKYNFQIYLTSDHGNVEAVGCGRPMEGAISDMRGERVRIYKDALLRAEVAIKYPGATEWPTIGLPDNYMPLIAPNRKAFILEGDISVTHGGICIEEVIVPLIQIDWRAI